MAIQSQTPRTPGWWFEKLIKQLGDKPGLSFESFGVGGAKIEGRAVAADGAVTPLKYSFYETDIRQAPYRSTWSDAQWTFDRFASRLGRGQALASAK